MVPNRFDEMSRTDGQRIRLTLGSPLQTPFRDQHAQIGTLPAVVPSAVNSQEERLRFVLQLVPVRARPAGRPEILIGRYECCPVGGASVMQLNGRGGFLDDHLAPDVSRGQLAPSRIDLVDVEFEGGIEVLQQMKGEQGDIRVRPGSHIRDRRRLR